ncbi:MAG: SulP family inorganic anion transporter [Gammaproteobacteria bacterium]|nr:SulP family inorganic anion transporter [Gammaproteobacteria bacterium]MBU1406595.1 SulP family inorganic anion transporter [Gammaproteobacteria bacterium]MBU1530903.1 SulP family inorganic anion transporter [Gammaproteobacteria bacterium]
MIDLKACPLWLYRLLPFLRWWPDVTPQTFKADSVAALTGAMIVLPQAVAFATIAGLPPEYGLYAAMVPAIVAALWGSSWHLVSGPTTAISIVVFASISPLAEPGSPQFIGLVLTLTLLAGLVQLAMGLARLGMLVNFISHTVIIGFTAGAAILIAASQIKNFFGLDMPRGAHFHEVLIQFGSHLADIQPWVMAVGLATLVSGMLAKRYLQKLPYMIVAMVAGSIVAAVLNEKFGAGQTGILTVGALAAGLPPLSLPDFSLTAIRQTLFPATIIAILALTEAVAIARSVATKSDQRIDSNQEFVGQGLSNIAGSFFSGYAGSGSFNRSGVNYASGAKTPLAAALSAVFLLLIVLLVAPLAAYLPVASMAAILFIVAWSLIDFHHIGEIIKRHKRERVVLALTFVGTLVDLEKGIFLGILVSLMFYLYRTSQPSIRELVPLAAEADNPRRKFVPVAPDSPKCPQMTMLRVEGSIFFGAAEHVQIHFRNVDESDPQKKHLLLTSRAIGFIDLAGAELLAKEATRRRKMGGGLYLVGVQPDLCKMLRRSGQVDTVGEDQIFRHKGEALQSIYSRLDNEICRTCTARIFRECHVALPDGTPR